MRNIFLTQLRNKKSDTAAFREAALKLIQLLASEAVGYSTGKDVKVETPLTKTTGASLKAEVVLVPILRSGAVMLPAFMSFFNEAKVGFIGLRRDEQTAVAEQYYCNLPKINKNTLVYLLDPMLATGGSSDAALQILLKNGAKEENIVAVYLISAPEGLQKIKTKYPKLNIVMGVEDKALNKNKFILPGIGDFGDRFFGTM